MKEVNKDIELFVIEKIVKKQNLDLDIDNVRHTSDEIFDIVDPDSELFQALYTRAWRFEKGLKPRSLSDFLDEISRFAEIIELLNPHAIRELDHCEVSDSNVRWEVCTLPLYADTRRAGVVYPLRSKTVEEFVYEYHTRMRVWVIRELAETSLLDILEERSLLKKVKDLLGEPEIVRPIFWDEQHIKYWEEIE